MAGAVRKLFFSLFVVVLVPALAMAQGSATDISRAFELERQGEFAAAAEHYRLVLGRNPANVSALMGLERVFTRLDHLDSIVPYVDSALVAQPDNRSVHALELRVLATLNRVDDLTAAAERWVAVMPRSAEPFREWAMAIARNGDVEGGLRVLADGARRVGRTALAQEMAELLIMARAWDEAAGHWHVAIAANPSLMGAGTTSLAQTPEEHRDRVVSALLAEGDDAVGGRIVADLLVGWGRPGEGWVVLDAALPPDAQVAVPMLRRFADRAGLMRTPDGYRAKGFALERLAELSVGPAAQRARVEAARAYADAGERRAAERMLERIAGGDGSGRNNGANAVATLIGVMAESGRVEEAEERFNNWRERLTADDVQTLRERLAWAWVRADDLERAETILADDSSVTVLAVRGWIALFHGDLLGATEHFRGAGPRAGGRDAVTQRTAVLALMQSVEPDSAPEMGGALHDLARGDSLAAVGALAAAAATLPPQGGRAPVLGLAGQVALEIAEPQLAANHLQASLNAHPDGAAAPTSAYHLARAYVQLGRTDEAQDRLERLILTFPESAVVPLARRMLDQLRGGVPRP